MNIALIIAGGTGNRMGQDIPKQFMHIKNSPIIIHTLKRFQKHPEIDEIVVVCLKGWETVLQSYANQYSITKLSHVLTGGDSGMSSIHNGIYGLKELQYHDDDLVLIHDGVRPLVSQSIITANIATAKKFGNAITAIKCKEAILESSDSESSNKSIPRDLLYRTQTPQTFFLKDIINAHEKAKALNITNSVSSCTLLSEIGGQEMYLVAGAEKNLKVTTTEDLEIFKALLNTNKEKWLK